MIRVEKMSYPVLCSLSIENTGQPLAYYTVGHKTQTFFVVTSTILGRF